MIDIRISADALQVSECINWATDSPDSGGIAVFIGTVRDKTKDKQVLRLEFEAYEKMALGEMQKIVEYSFHKWPLQKVLVHHRVGTLVVGDIPVVICVASAHRAAAFDACRYIIDTLKQTVPIWKKEVFADGAVWVAAHP